MITNYILAVLVAKSAATNGAFFTPVNYLIIFCFLALELGDALISLEKFGEALTFYQRATELMPNSTLSYLFTKEKVAKTFVKMGDLHNGLHAFTEMANIAEQICKKPATSIYLDILAK